MKPLFLLSGGEGAKTAWAQFSAFLIGDGQARWEQMYGWSPPKLLAGDGNGPRSRPNLLQLKRFVARSGNVQVWEVDYPGIKEASKIALEGH